MVKSKGEEANKREDEKGKEEEWKITCFKKEGRRECRENGIKEEDNEGKGEGINSFRKGNLDTKSIIKTCRCSKREG